MRLVVAAGLSLLAPVVDELSIFSAAFLAGFARGAGRRFGAAGVLGVFGITVSQIHLSAIQTFSLDPMEFVAPVFVRARKIP